MTNVEQQSQPAVNPPDLAKYENDSGFNPEDMDILTAFTGRISSELRQVDQQNVGSNSNIQAHQLEQKKILSGLETTKSVASSTTRTTSEQTQETTVTKNPQPSGTQVKAPQPPPAVEQLPSVTTDVIEQLNHRLTRIESSVKTIQKSRRIKKGVSYTVSSNGFKGVIKDAELLAEFVINEVAKGVKTITIRSTNDIKNKE